MVNSQNGYPVIASDETVKWIIPIKSGNRKHLVLRPGHSGFVLIHFALWFHERVEPLNTQDQWDDWGWAYRNVRGSSSTISNHASGTAMDLNATKHPLGKANTFNNDQETRIRTRLGKLNGVLRWGGDYRTRKDEMHFEINKGYSEVVKLAKRLQSTPRGVRIKEANSHY